MEMKWIVLGILGVLVLALFSWLLFMRNQTFDAAMLGLLTLGLILIGVGCLQPDSIKYGDVEIGKMRREAQMLKEEAETAIRQSKEALAMQIWNAGRWDIYIQGQEEAATKMLKDLYGEKGLDYRYYLQHKGVLKTPKDELEHVPVIKNPPAGTEESFFREYLLKQSKETVNSIDENKK